MTIYYLMVKTHNITGLQYLCQTKKKDPYKYLGSGIYWKRHLKKHGADITTKIVKECSSKQELSEFGLYYSSLWNIVEDASWANMIPESGSGGRATFGETHCMKRPEVIAKISGDNHYSKRPGYDKTKHHMIGKNHSGVHNPRFIEVTFKFRNNITGEIVEMTQYDFVSKYKLDQGNINKLISGKYKTCAGWILH